MTKQEITIEPEECIYFESLLDEFEGRYKKTWHSKYSETVYDFEPCFSGGYRIVYELVCAPEIFHFIKYKLDEYRKTITHLEQCLRIVKGEIL